MASLGTFLTKIGGYATIGVFIDFLLSKKEGKKLKEWLATWWIRFDDVKWHNFGRVEAEYAIKLLDRYADANLWSWRRWRFVLGASAAAYLFAIAWSAVRFFWTQSDRGAELLRGVMFVLQMNVEWFAPRWLAIIVLIVMTFAISLSVTRLIAVVAGRLSRNVASTILAFSLLLLFHLFLLVVWNSFAMDAVLRAVQVLIDQVFGGTFDMAAYGEFLRRTLRLASRGYDVVGSWSVLFSTTPHFAYSLGVQEMVFYSFKAVVDIIANGIRIGFALIFLGSFVFRPLIQRPISRIWVGIVDSEKPVFTLILAGIGVLLEAGAFLL